MGEPERAEECFYVNPGRSWYAEMCRVVGLGGIGHLLSCNRNGCFCEGRSDRITMERGQTIMGGASHCAFRYRYEEE